MFEKIKEKSSFTYLSVLVGTRVKAIEALEELAFVLSIWLATQFYTREYPLCVYKL